MLQWATGARARPRVLAAEKFLFGATRQEGPREVVGTGERFSHPRVGYMFCTRDGARTLEARAVTRSGMRSLG